MLSVDRGIRYKLAAIKLVTPSKEHLEKHYEDLSEKPFFKGLVNCMLLRMLQQPYWGGGGGRGGGGWGGAGAAGDEVNHHDRGYGE